MNRHAKKRRALQWRIVRYIIMVSTIFAIVTFSVLVLLGYRLNRTTGVIQQGGLVQFVSEPTKASVTIGSAKLMDKTPSKITVNPGEYLVKMEKDGYQLWQKNVSIKAGEVLWLNSAKLVPRDITTVALRTIPTVADSFAQPKSGFISTLPDASKPVVERYDIRTGDIKSETFDLSALKTAVAKNNSYRFLEWNGSTRRTILDHTYGTKHELIVMNVDSKDSSFVVTPQGKAVPIDAIPDPRNSRDLIVRYSDGSVRLIDGDNGSVSQAVLTNTTVIKSFGSSIVYVRSAGKNMIETGYLTLDSQLEPQSVRRISTQQPVQFQIQQYFDTYYLTTVVGKNMIVQSTMSLPRSSDDTPVSLKLVLSLELDSVPVSLRRLDIGQQISILQPSAVTNYDVESKSVTTTNLTDEDQKALGSLKWLDEFHYYLDNGGMLRQYEYDGENQADITAVEAGHAAGYSQNGKYLYTFAKDKSGFTLQRSTMILDN